jgi:tetratricopeptide (TPR) repeat protein
MKWCLYVFSLTTILTMTGCTTLIAKQSDVSSQIDSWLVKHEYDKALATIAVMSADHPDYPYLSNAIPVIEKKRQKYIQSILAEARLYEPTQDWVSAKKVIKGGLQSLPDAPELVALLDFYNAKRSSRILKDESAILIARAHYLIQARPYQESKLYNAENRFFAQQHFNKFLEEARNVSRELYVIGQRYWQEEKMVQAREALTLSIRTAPNELSAELLTSILNTEQTQRSVARKEQKKQITEQLPELERSFYERINFGDFLGAQKVLNEMNAMEISSAKTLQVTLDEKKETRIQTLIASGNTLYNSGFLQEAISRWNQALELDPENQTILQQLERAKKFIGNLERWKNKP